jgi:zona occludens toxin (predicted ATPase)
MVAHYDDIDWSYCHKNAAKLGCGEKFEEIQKEAKRIKRQMDMNADRNK